MKTHLTYLETCKALAHTQSMRTGAGAEELAAFLIATARLLEAQCLYGYAVDCIGCAADVYGAG